MKKKDGLKKPLKQKTKRKNNKNKKRINIKSILIIILFLILMITSPILITQYRNSESTRIKEQQNYEQILEEKQTENSNLQTQIEEKDKTVNELNTKIEELNSTIEEQQKQIEALKIAKANKTTTTSRGGSSTNERIPAATGTKAEYQAYARNLCLNTYGWSENDVQCLIKLWTKESNWNPNAHNSSSGAHGIPQSLPASKMASEGSDYLTNYKTQIRWGLKYIKNRYGTPAKAWAHFQNHNWY